MATRRDRSHETPPVLPIPADSSPKPPQMTDSVADWRGRAVRETATVLAVRAL
jgi:hypothetical protein